MATHINGKAFRSACGLDDLIPSVDHNQYDNGNEREWRIAQYAAIADDCDSAQVSLFDVELDAMPEFWSPDKVAASPEQLAEWERNYVAKSAPLPEGYDVLAIIDAIDNANVEPVKSWAHDAERGYRDGMAMETDALIAAYETAHDKMDDGQCRYVADRYWQGIVDAHAVQVG